MVQPALEDLYLAHRVVIERVIGGICRRQGLSRMDAEDFAGGVRLKLVENDGEVLRKYQGRSSIQTYLAVVVTHLFQDWRNSRWGKWRPSADAKRLGPTAILTERLIHRDGLRVDEAYETLRSHYQYTDSRAALESLVGRLPARSSRQFVSVDALEEHPADHRTGEDAVEESESAAAASRAGAALRAALGSLAPQDRLILRMRFEDDFSIVNIARTLGLDQKALYRRLERMLSDLRAQLLRQGVSPQEVAAVLAQGGFDRLADPEAPENGADVRPDTGGGRRATHIARTP